MRPPRLWVQRRHRHRHHNSLWRETFTPLLYMVVPTKVSWPSKWMMEWPQLEAINNIITMRADMEVLERQAMWGCLTVISRCMAGACV